MNRRVARLVCGLVVLGGCNEEPRAPPEDVCRVTGAWSAEWGSFSVGLEHNGSVCIGLERFDYSLPCDECPGTEAELLEDCTLIVRFRSSVGGDDTPCEPQYWNFVARRDGNALVGIEESVLRDEQCHEVVTHVWKDAVAERGRVADERSCED